MSPFKKAVNKRIHPDLAALIECQRKVMERQLKSPISFNEASKEFLQKFGGKRKSVKWQ